MILNINTITGWSDDMPKKISILMAAILLCVSLTGCTSMIPLTDEEEEEIAIYTSSLISKYNRNQTNGLTYISDQRRSEIEELEAIYHPDEEEAIEPDDSFTETDALTEESEGTEEVDATTDDELRTDGSVNPTNTVEEVTGETITLTDLVGKSGISVSYQGAAAATHYGSDGVFDLSPTKGYQFLVMNFQLKNTSSSAVSVDLSGLGFVFRATVDGVTARADQTILLDDLQTFEGSIPAGGTEKLVLLFQYPSSGLNDLSNLSLGVDKGGNTYTVVL